MNRKNAQTYQMLTRVLDFGTRNVGLFPENSAATEILATLETGVKKLSEHASARISAESAMQAARSALVAARENLKTRLAHAEQIARALNSDSIRFPAKRPDQALINGAQAFVLDSESMKEEFLKYGFAVEEVSPAVENMKNALLTYTSAKSTRAAAIREWTTWLEESMGALHRFDALVANALENNPGALASYEVARNIGPTRSRKAAESPKEAEAAPAAEAVTAA